METPRILGLDTPPYTAGETQIPFVPPPRTPRHLLSWNTAVIRHPLVGMPHQTVTAAAQPPPSKPQQT